MKKLLLLMMISVMLVGMMIPVGAFTIDGATYDGNCTGMVADINATCGENIIMTGNVVCGASEVLTGGACGISPFFHGTFDGQNFTITNLTISSGATHQGLFRRSSGTIMNVGLVNVNVSGGDSVGGLVGSQTYAGISNTYVTGSVSGNDKVGGLVGDSSFSTSVSDSFATGSVSGNNYVGGLVGNQYYGTVTNSYATGSVSGGDSVGGLVGYSRSFTTVDNSFATGNVIGGTTVGGLVGKNGGTITNSFWFNFTGNPSSGVGSGIDTTITKTDLNFFIGDVFPLIQPFASWTGSFNNDPWNECIGPDGFPALDSAQCSEVFVPLPPDADGDGVGDGSDLCPGTEAQPTDVDSNGCADAQVDSDGDGICDPGALSAGPTGCTGSDNCPAISNFGQADGDFDLVGDACDSCPADSLNECDNDWTRKLNDDLFYTLGRVGISTSTPDARFHVAGSSQVEGIKVGAGGYIYHDGSQLIIGTD